jgi:two-component system OmpR family sensor kinase
MLATSAEHVTAELATARSRADSVGVLHASLLLGSAMRVYGTRGDLLLQSSGVEVPIIQRSTTLSRSRPPYPFVSRFAPSTHQGRHGRGAFSMLSGPTRWRVYTMPLPDGSLDAFAPLGRIDASVRRFGVFMIVIAIVGTVVSFFAGWLVAGYALRPVSHLTETAAAIARSREFSRRVTGDWIPAHHDELGTLAATFNEMLSSLEKAYSAQQRFVSDASHELRAPLTTIQANLELLRDRKDMLPGDRDIAVLEAAQEAGRLSRLVADLLALAHADAGVPLRRAHVELDRVLMDVTGEARHLLTGQHLGIEKLTSATLKGDADRIKQLLLILVDNAIRYTPSGGRVSVSLERKGERVVFTVRDSGIGIPADELPRVFERFYRADPARSRDPAGTGLGLSIAQSIIREHAGDISLASVRGQGTVATVTFPAGEGAGVRLALNSV